MLSDMTSMQLSEWMAFYKLEPFGYEANMYGHAITASTVANANRKKGRKSFRVDDFMPKLKELPNTKTFFANLRSILMLNKPKEKK